MSLFVFAAWLDMNTVLWIWTTRVISKKDNVKFDIVEHRDFLEWKVIVSHCICHLLYGQLRSGLLHPILGESITEVHYSIVLYKL